MTTIGQMGISERLRTFVEEMPAERESILRFVTHAAQSVSSGARVLDVGAGDAPYRELFDHADYITADWGNSPHEGSPDVTASGDALPFADASFEAALLTQVLEHVPEPVATLSEVFRVLAEGGRLFATVPLVWELHEEPWDFFRYTSHGITHVLEAAGFSDIAVEARNDCFATLAQLMRNVAWVGMGERVDDGLDARREEARSVLLTLAEQVEVLGPLDTRWILPLGYAVVARKKSVPARVDS